MDVHSELKSMKESLRFALTIIIGLMVISPLIPYSPDFYLMGYKALYFIASGIFTLLSAIGIAIIGIMFIKLIVWIKEIFEW